MRTRNLAKLERFFFKLRVFLALYAVFSTLTLLVLWISKRHTFPLSYLIYSIPLALIIFGITWPIHNIARKMNKVWREKKEKAENEIFGEIR